MRREDLREGLLVIHGLRVGLFVWNNWFMAAPAALLLGFVWVCLCLIWEGRRGIVCARRIGFYQILLIISLSKYIVKILLYQSLYI